MMRRTTLYGALLVGLSVGEFGCSTPAPEPARTEDAPDPPPAPKPRHPALNTGSQGGIDGKVTKIGPDWFEIGAGWDGELDIAKKKHNEGNDKPIQVFVGGTLVAGDPQGLGNPSLETYLFTDMKVGDVVSIYTSVTRDGQQYAVNLIIRRRPGGKIPLPADHFGKPSVISARNQTEQDWEEKGIPIPKKYLDKRGRAPWTNPPYPPVAPEPRPAKATP